MPGKTIALAHLPRRLLRENLVLLLVALLVPLPLLGPFTRDAAGRNLSVALFQGLGILLLLLFVLRIELRGGGARFRYLLQSGVNAPVAAFLVWTAIGIALAPDRAFAIGELLRVTSGAAIYFALALYLERREQLELLLDYLVLLLVLLIGHALLFPAQAVDQISALFPSNHHFSAILTVMFPVMLSLAFGATEQRRAIPALAATVLCAVGLFMSVERSAWLATLFGVGVWYSLRFTRPAERRARSSWRGGAVVGGAVLIAAIVFMRVTSVGADVASRAMGFKAVVAGKDGSFAWRVQKWRGAARMVAERPLLGWGPGQFPLQQSTRTGLGLERADVREHGASFDEMAYNEYLQVAAELGLPGLALFLLILASFIAKAIGALRRLRDGIRRSVLQGAVAGIAAFMVDACANGSWRYMECSVFFWLVLGLGVATTRMAYAGRSARSERRTRTRESIARSPREPGAEADVPSEVRTPVSSGAP